MKKKIAGERDELDGHFKDLAEEKRNLKNEALRVYREKIRIQEDLKNFNEFKQIVEDEDNKVKEEFNNDYKFIDD